MLVSITTGTGLAKAEWMCTYCSLSDARKQPENSHIWTHVGVNPELVHTSVTEYSLPVYCKIVTQVI